MTGMSHLFLAFKFDSNREQLYNSIKLVERNDKLINTITSLLQNKIYTNVEIQKEDIEREINLFEYSLSILYTGGMTIGFENNFKLPEPDKRIVDDISQIETLWSSFKTEIERINKAGIQASSNQFSTINELAIEFQLAHNKILSFYNFNINKYTSYNRIISIISVIIYLIMLLLLISVLRNRLIKPLKTVEKALDSFTDAETAIQFELLKNTEYTGVYTNLNNLRYKINEISSFVNHLVKDNYEVRFKDYNKKNILELSLVKLRDKLKENVEINKKRQEEEKLRQWFADGKARFNDILRESSTGMSTLAEASLKHLVKFFHAAQGGFFIFNEEKETPHLELISAFAYDRIKALTKTIQLGEGLIGMCALERNTIWLNNIPEGYMEIESGLGESAPNNLLIVPVKTEESLIGVIEIATFNEFNKNEVQFIENIAEDIASTLETTRISDRTSELLEESQKKSDELAMRDSEMSQKIEELREAQKETKRSETEMSGLISAVDRLLFKAELSLKGRVITANSLFMNTFKYTSNDLKTKSFFEFIADSQKESIVNDIMNTLNSNESVQKNIAFVTNNNKKLNISCLFSSIKNESDQTVRILFLGDNISYEEELIKKNETLAEEILYKNKIIKEKEKELSENINQSLKTENNRVTNKELMNFIERENNLKKQFESPAEKKYSNWLKEISIKK
jgi:putative methionine-R-sulfoxide reductase with GAF domain